MKSKCPKCSFLVKKFGKKDLIFECKYWGLKSQRKLPDIIVRESIGKDCPFFKELSGNKGNIKNVNNGNSGGLDILI